MGTNFPIAIYWGPELALIYNDAWSAIPGEKHPWALGRPGSEVWPEIWDAIGPLFDSVQTTGDGVWQEDQLLPMHRHGYTEECYFNFTFSPIKGENGTVEGIFNAVVETTFRVIEERRERTLRELGESLSAKRTEDEVIKVAIDLLGRKPEDVPFCLFYRVQPNGQSAALTAEAGLGGASLAPRIIDLADATWPMAEAADQFSAVVIEDIASLIGSNPPSRAWPEAVNQVLVSPVGGAPTAGNLIGFLVTGISPRRALTDDYRAFFERAAIHIGTALANARAYEDAQRKAEALAEIDRAKTAFFSNVSHEFRTPLTLMLGPIEDLLTDKEHLSEVERERAEILHRNALRLLKLVNTLLDFSRVEAGRTQANLVPTDLAKLTGYLASTFRSAMERAGLEYVVDIAPLSRAVPIDSDMWEKIVLNLLSNAFKFTLQGRISVRLTEEADQAVLSIADTGEGIPEAELPRLFERFHRIEGTQGRTIEGSGIGLALVQELVRFHGGDIEVSSQEAQGSVFQVSIPFGQGENAAADNASTEASSTAVRAESFVQEALRWLPEGTSLPLTDTSSSEVNAKAGIARIVLADDNADMRAYVHRLLASSYVVEVVADGLEALEAVRRERPDLLLTDIMMPKLDGFELIRTIREDAALRDLPIIALSARAGEEARVAGLDGGADDYLVKPFAARELVATVQSNLELARLRSATTAALRESERRFRNMADHAPVMMWVTDADGMCTYLNRGWYEFTGQTEAEGLGYGWLKATHPDDTSHAAEVFQSASGARTPFRIEYRLRRADGDYRWAIDAGAPRFDDTGAFAGYVGSVIDITDRKKAEIELNVINTSLEERVAEEVQRRSAAERALRQAQKMESLGQLTGGVAHDFNNLLQVIAGNLQLLSKDVASNDKAARRVSNALAGVDRGAKLASQLLAFGRKQPLEPKVVNIGRFVSDIEDMLRRTIGEGIEIETIRAGGLWNALVDPVQVENAILNLAINARDAMEGRGKLTIEVGNAFLDDEYARHHDDVAPGQYVMLAVTDTGTGIPAEIVEQVFEPFFSTKPVGKGTGLGLSMVYGFVKQSGGHIKIYSEVGHGTTLKLYFPRVQQQEDLVADVDAGPVRGGSETILIAEDDEQVRNTVVELLSDLGYGVLKAKDASAALTIIESGMHIDLLFTDVVMPGPLRSPDLARQAKARQPHIAVLFTSGYTENSIVHGGRLDAGVELLSKPYTREALARKLRHVLDNEKQKAASTPAVDGPSPRLTPSPLRSNPPLRLLVVEDEPIIRLDLCDMLREAGHEVYEAETGVEAINILKVSRVDVLLTDMGLPGMSGEELARQVRAELPAIAVIFATGQDQIPELPGAHNVTLLRKPFGPTDIAEAIARVRAD